MGNKQIQNIIEQRCCFNLQFRKDTRYERTNSPTYYRWKAQFIVAAPREKTVILKRIRRFIGCGKIYLIGRQIHLSVQKIDDIFRIVVPFFKKNKISGQKKREFEIWQKAISMLYHNKGMPLSKWPKSDTLQLIEIYKSSAKYKNKKKPLKWLEMAKFMATDKKHP